MNDKIKSLQAEIDVERQRIRNCKHEPGDVYYVPEIIKEPYGYEMKAHGSNIWYQPTGYRDVTKPRCARKCKHCGFIEYTYVQKPIISGYDPSF